MTVTGLITSWLFGREGAAAMAKEGSSGFKNPFSWGPLLKFGLIFTGVLFLAKAGSYHFGLGGQKVTALAGGLMDVDAILLSAGDFYNHGSTLGRDGVLVLLLAALANAVFKSGLAVSSGQKAFYLRVIAGFGLMFLSGFLVWWLM
jgi:uncharacterized membrane protein (DUF4010 family)